MIREQLVSHPEWSGLTDAEVAALLVEPNVALHEARVTAGYLQILLGVERAGEVMAGLRAASETPALTPAQQETVRGVIAYCYGAGVDVGSPVVRAQLPQFTAMGVITAAEAQSLLDLGATTSYLAEGATAADVAAARAEIAREKAYQAAQAAAVAALNEALGQLALAYEQGRALPTITVSVA
jgi:hypothetical protein